jgi:hypothetical protein
LAKTDCRRAPARTAKARWAERRAWKSLIIDDLEVSLFALCESRTNVVQIVSDHAQADPTLHYHYLPGRCSAEDHVGASKR